MIAETSRAGRLALTTIIRQSRQRKSFHSSHFRNSKAEFQSEKDHSSHQEQQKQKQHSSQKKTKTENEKIAEADERIRQMLLDRDGGPASVPTREGKWDSDMGRETARQMFRVLDQTRQNNPGTDTAKGEGESKYWNRRNY